MFVEFSAMSVQSLASLNVDNCTWRRNWPSARRPQGFAKIRLNTPGLGADALYLGGDVAVVPLRMDHPYPDVEPGGFGAVQGFDGGEALHPAISWH